MWSHCYTHQQAGVVGPALIDGPEANHLQPRVQRNAQRACGLRVWVKGVGYGCVLLQLSDKPPCSSVSSVMRSVLVDYGRVG